MRIDNEAGELRATLRPAAGCSVVFTFLFFLASLGVVAISGAVLLWLRADLTGGTPPAILAPYAEQLPWHGHADRTALLVAGVWTVIWLWFAIGIGTALLRALFGSDVVAAGADLSVTKSIGPFGRTRSFALQSIRGFGIHRKDDALIVRLDDGSVQWLTTSGTAKERMQLRDLLRDRIPPVSPTEDRLTPRFEESVQPDGTHVVRVSAQSRRKTAGCVGAFAAAWLAATAWHIYRDRVVSPADPMLIVAALIAAVAFFVWKAEETWQVRKGWFLYERRFGPYQRRSVYETANFSVDESKDSDGDVWFRLYAEANGRKELLQSGMNDAIDVVALGRFLARVSGFPFYGLRDE